MVLIYAEIVPAIITDKSESMKELRLRSKILLFSLAESKATVFLPTVAIAELLVPVPESQKGVLIAQLGERFVIPPFDLRAAAIASDLEAKYRNLSQAPRYEQRNVLKADAMIIASAKAAGAVEFFTSDQRCRTMANLVMDGKDLPAHSEKWMFLRNDLEAETS
jgi:predicted nucleic acid-binding protein